MLRYGHKPPGNFHRVACGESLGAPIQSLFRNLKRKGLA